MKSTADSGNGQLSSFEKVLVLFRVSLTSNGFDWMYPALLIAATLLYELLSFATMTIISDFYMSITSRDGTLFVYTLEKSCLVVVLVSVAKSCQQYFADMCSLQWRKKIVTFIHYHYFSCIALKDISLKTKRIQDLMESNPEQRISQDVDKLTLEFSRVFDKFLITPVLIVFYTYYLWVLFGSFAPLSCYVYFTLGAFGSTFLARRMIIPIMKQEKFEGEFRLNHSNLSRYLFDINLLGGVNREKDVLTMSLSHIVANTKVLIRSRFFVNLFLNLHSYTGSIVSYIIVGSAVLYDVNSDENASSSEIASYVSQGSYACLYLVSSFSTLLSLAESLSEICGLSERITNLLMLISLCHDSGCEQQASLQEMAQSHVSDAVSGSIDASQCPSGSTSASKHRADCGQPALSRFNVCSNAFFSVYYGMHREAASDGPVYRALSPGDVEVGLRTMLCDEEHAWKLGQGHHRDILPGETVLRVSNLDVHSPARCLIPSLSFDISVGDRLLITGPVGCGKSTIISYLANSISDESSVVNIVYNSSIIHESSEVLRSNIERSIPVREDSLWRALGVHQSVVFLPQAAYCFQGSLLENVLYPHSLKEVLCKYFACDKTKLSSQEYEDRVQKVRGDINKLINELLRQMGLGSLAMLEHDTTSAISSHNCSSSDQDRWEPSVDWPTILSVGQKQLLSLTRAIFKRPTLLVLDEATNSLDKETEVEVYDVVVKNSKASITIGRHASCLAHLFSHELRILPKEKSYTFQKIASCGS